MLSIGMFTYSTKPRGSVVHAASLAEALTAAGHDVTIYALAKDGSSFFRPLSCAVDLIAAGLAPAGGKDALIRQRIGEFARGFRARPMRHDVFHAQDCLAASALLAENARTRGRIARTVHHVDRFDDPYLAACQERSIARADLVFSVSRMTQREVKEQFDRPTELVYNGVDTARFAGPSRRHAVAVRQKVGVAGNDLLVLSVGGVEPRKNTRRSLAAVARLYERDPRVMWIIVGGDSIWDHSAYRAAFDQDLADLEARLPGLSSRILQPGTVSEETLTGLYRASDVLLCPSLHEGFGLSVLEAMAAGTAVIAPAREPFTEYLDERSAAMVDPESSESIAAALLALGADPTRRMQMTVAARAAAARFSWGNAAAAHVEHYQARFGRGSPALGTPAAPSAGEGETHHA